MYYVLTKKGCIWCDEAKALLRRRALVYHETKCESVDEARAVMGVRFGLSPVVSTFPLIVHESDSKAKRFVGGFEHLRDELTEPILQKTSARFCMFPVVHDDLFEFYKKLVASYWTTDEVSLAQDVHDWRDKLSADERFFVSHILAFFAGADGIVTENLAANFCVECQIPEARAFYSGQIFQESVHSHQYSLLIDALIEDPSEAETMFRAIDKLKPVRDKAAWAQTWINPERRFCERLVGFVCVEGILFSSSFCAIYWLKRRSLMPGLTMSNEFIARDEALHYAFGCALFRKLVNPPPEDVVRQIVSSAVDTELAFVTDAIPCRLIGLNADSMSEYIKFVADRALLDLGYSPMYNATNPFDWMSLISMASKTNFFEKTATEYQRAGVMANASDQIFALDGDF